MARVTRTVYLGERNKGLSSTFQPPEEGRRIQRPKRCDKHGDKDEDNSLKNVNNVNKQSVTFLNKPELICFQVLLSNVNNSI